MKRMKRSNVYMHSKGHRAPARNCTLIEVKFHSFEEINYPISLFH